MAGPDMAPRPTRRIDDEADEILAELLSEGEGGGDDELDALINEAESEFVKTANPARIRRFDRRSLPEQADRFATGALTEGLDAAGMNIPGHIYAGFHAATNPLTGFGSDAENFSDRYSENIDQWRGTKQDFQKENPTAAALVDGTGAALGMLGVGAGIKYGARGVANMAADAGNIGTQRGAELVEKLFTYAPGLAGITQGAAGAGTWMGTSAALDGGSTADIASQAGWGAAGGAAGAAAGAGLGYVGGKAGDLVANAVRRYRQKRQAGRPETLSMAAHQLLRRTGIDPETMSKQEVQAFRKAFDSADNDDARLAAFFGAIEGRGGPQVQSAAALTAERQAQKAVGDLNQQTGRMNAQAEEQARRALNPDPADITAAELEYNVPLSPAQRRMESDPRRPGELVKEEMTRKGMRGEPAEHVMKSFDQFQADRADLARERLSTRISGLTNTRDQGALTRIDEINEAVAQANERTRAAAGQKFEDLRPQMDTALIDADGYQGVLGRVTERLDRATGGGDGRDGVYAPAVERIVSRLRRLSTNRKGKDVEVSYSAINRMRQDIDATRAAGDNPTRQQLGILKQSLDKEFDRALARGFFSGDPKFLGDLRSARAAWADYKKRFYKRKGEYRNGQKVPDRAGPLIEMMASGGADTRQVAQALFGGAQSHRK